MTTASTDWKETPGPDEDARFERLAEQLAATQKARGDASLRALHAKGLAGARATLRVLPDLPEPLRQGLFAAPRELRAYVRLSNGAGARQTDRAPDLRGLAIKVLGVDGPKVLGDAATQDLLMIDSPTVPFRTPEEFVGFVCATAERKGAIGRVVRELGLWRTLGLLAALARTAKGSPRSALDRRYYGAAAVAFGPYAARYGAVPVAGGAAGAAGPGADYLGAGVAARLREAPFELELRAQPFTTEAETPLEDSTRPWRSPWTRVARLTIERQDLASPGGQRLQAFVETLSFDPWHALLAHRPLGVVMRARKHAYFASIRQRGAAPEPDGSEWGSFA